MPTLPPPPDSPNTVTFLGSPPKLDILSRIHSKACTTSSIPTLPEYSYFLDTAERSRKPRMFKRWLMLTTTTSFLANCIPGFQADVPESKPPPCNHSITGLRAFRSVLHTFSTHEFFSDISSSESCCPHVCCITCGPQWSHLCMPFHLSTGSGGISRSTLA